MSEGRTSPTHTGWILMNDRKSFCAIYGNRLYVLFLTCRELHNDNMMNGISTVFDLRNCTKVNTLGTNCIQISDNSQNVIKLETENKTQTLMWLFAIKFGLKYQASLSLDGFRKISVIGQDSFGDVCLMQRFADNKLYAIKSFPKDFLGNKFSAELVEMYLIPNHKNIAGISISFATKDMIYIGIEYPIGGEMIFNAISESVLFSQFFQVAEAINHCHMNDVVVKAFTPENLLLDHENNVVLCDFGLKTKREVNEYSSPEAIINHSLGVESNWWAYGVMLYEMAVGTSPFLHEDESKMSELILKSTPNLSLIDNNHLKDIISGLLEKSPKRRTTYGIIKTHQFFKSSLEHEISCSNNMLFKEMDFSSVLTDLSDQDLFAIMNLKYPNILMAN